jgi:hypothetical protein
MQSKTGVHSEAWPNLQHPQKQAGGVTNLIIAYHIFLDTAEEGRAQLEWKAKAEVGVPARQQSRLIVRGKSVCTLL